MMQRWARTFLLLVAMAVPQGLAAEAGKREPKNPKEDVEAIGERDVGKGINFYSIEKEIALGKQLAEEVERSARIVDDAMISEYVNRIGQNLVRNSDARVPFTIKVIESDEVNAFALPGGFFFVNTGILKLAESEAELAGVMAHEIAHVTARHGTRQATRGEIANLATIPLIFLGGWSGYGIQQAANFAIPMTFLKFSRNFERDADFLGTQYLYNSGYDPTAMVQFFERLQVREKSKKNALAKVFSSHPMTEGRIRLVQETIDELLPARPEYAVNTSEFEEIKAHLERVQARRYTDDEEPNRPTLRRKAPNETIEPGDEQPGEEDDDEGPPVLKRRPAVNVKESVYSEGG